MKEAYLFQGLVGYIAYLRLLEKLRGRKVPPPRELKLLYRREFWKVAKELLDKLLR